MDKSQFDGMWEKAGQIGCAPDYILDAICMSVTAAMHAHGMCETIPEKPEEDSKGLKMQMIVPKSL